MRLPPKSARWKRCVPRLAIINVWISKGFYLHSLHLARQFAPRLPPQNMIFHALASLQFDFILRGCGITAELSAFDRVPRELAILVIVRVFFRSLPRVEQIFARREVFELERAVALDRRFCVAEQVIDGGSLSRDQVDAKPFRQLRAFTRRDDTAAQACRALGDYQFNSRNLLALLERDAGASNVNWIRRRGLRDRAEVPVFTRQIGADPITARLHVLHSEAAVFLGRGAA